MAYVACRTPHPQHVHLLRAGGIEFMSEPESYVAFTDDTLRDVMKLLEHIHAPTVEWSEDTLYMAQRVSTKQSGLASQAILLLKNKLPESVFETPLQ